MEFLVFLVVAGMIVIAGIATWVGRRGRRTHPGVRNSYSGVVGSSYDGGSSGGWFDGSGGGFGGDGGGGGGGGCGGGS